MLLLGCQKVRSMNRIGLFLFLLAFLVIAGFSQTVNATDRGPIKIGLIAPLTGSFAQQGADIALGAKMFLEGINYTAAGRKIELIVEDDAANPNNSIAKARKLISHDKVSIITGLFLGSTSYAVAPICEQARVPIVNTNSASDDLTQRKRSNNMIRLCYTSCQIGHVAGDYAYNELGWRTIPILGWEHSFGQEVLGSFQTVFEEAGGKVIQRIYTPLGTLDFSPYVSTIKRKGDGLFEVVTGGASMRFLKVLKASGLMNKWKILAVLTATDPTFLQELRDTALGVLSVDGYAVTLDNPDNKRFKDLVRKKTGRDANSTLLYAYDGLNWIVRAIEALNGDLSSYERLIKVLRSIEIPDSPRGPMKLDSYGQVVQNFYVRKVEKVRGHYQNTVIKTYPMVSQFWKFDPEEYLKKPVYSRENTPCRYCD